LEKTQCHMETVAWWSVTKSSRGAVQCQNAEKPKYMNQRQLYQSIPEGKKKIAWRTNAHACSRGGKWAQGQLWGQKERGEETGKGRSNNREGKEKANWDGLERGDQYNWGTLSWEIIRIRSKQKEGGEKKKPGERKEL